MDRKETARQTLAIMEQGYYQYGDSKIEIRSALEASVRGSFLITPQQAEELLAMYNVSGSTAKVLYVQKILLRWRRYADLQKKVKRRSVY